MAKTGKLTPKKRAAIAALLTERDTKSAAEAAGVGYRTLCRWLDLPEFRAELRAAETTAIDQAIRRLADLTGDAIDTLRAVMTDVKAAPGSRVQAANVALSRLLDLRELAELEARLGEIEKALKIGESKR